MEFNLQAAGLRRSAVAISPAAWQQVEARVKTDQDIFDFHSGLWMNLHLMEKHWQPYLDGKSDFAQAIKQMVAGL